MGKVEGLARRCLVKPCIFYKDQEVRVGCSWKFYSGEGAGREGKGWEGKGEGGVAGAGAQWQRACLLPSMSRAHPSVSVTLSSLLSAAPTAMT